MRWTLRISFILFLAWAIFMVSPFVALHDLAKAVEVRNVDQIEERVNFNALRISLARQILGDSLNAKDLGGLDRKVAAEAGAAVLNPVLEELVTPQALADLLKNGLPEQASQGSLLGGTTGLDLGSARDAWHVFIQSEAQGFRSVTIPLPVRAQKDNQFRLTMRLKGTTWRLSGIELPQALRIDLAKRASLAAK